MKSKIPHRRPLIVAALAIAAVCMFALPALARVAAPLPADGPAFQQADESPRVEALADVTLMTVAPLMLFGMAVSAYQRIDNQLKVTKALPSGASAINTDGINLAQTTNGHLLADCQLKIEAPALTTGMLGDAATMKYDVECDDNSSFSSARVIGKEVVVQTGAGGAGASAATKYFRLPSDCEQYVRVKGTKSAAGDASSLSVTVSLAF